MLKNILLDAMLSLSSSSSLWLALIESIRNAAENKTSIVAINFVDRIIVSIKDYDVST